ncbi:hypothetical protein SBRCBS47491_003982 [Sporothrix bragantina]|uniref:Uncharacterized protein n=1 Tax=Sporothrix bragantina TaxID=671064 RepID=A0ABP0BK50_9PEZI
MLAVDDPLIPQFHKEDPHSGVTVTEHSHHDTYDAINPRKLDLAGKSVFLTGASRGIGPSIAVAYARAGVSFIALAARGSMDKTVEAVTKAAQEAGRSVPTMLPLKMDASDPASVQAAADATKAALNGKPLDIVVNNAAVLEPNTTVHESKPEDWWFTFEINVKGVYLVCRAMIPLLLGEEGQPRGGRMIVNVSSQGAILIIHGMSAYNTSKLAVCRLTEYLAYEYKEQDLTAISIHPGGVMSDMSMALPSELHEKVITDTPELVSDTIVYLTREPQTWLNGRYVSVLWDLPELEARRDEIVAKDLLKSKFIG